MFHDQPNLQGCYPGRAYSFRLVQHWASKAGMRHLSHFNLVNKTGFNPNWNLAAACSCWARFQFGSNLVFTYMKMRNIAHPGDIPPLDAHFQQ